MLIALGVPSEFRDRNRCVYSGEEGFLLLLRRLNYPARLADLVKEFGLSETRLSLLLDLVSEFVWTKFRHLIEDPTVWCDHLPLFADSIHAYLGTYTNVWGFIDDTLCGIADLAWANA